jgi:glycosyltransferase involved in cell wall biosynthesis
MNKVLLMKYNLTVCILSYNRPKYLLETLRSVLEQTILPEKILIYDNGSNEEVLSALAIHINSFVGLVRSEKNYPPIWNFRRAAAECSSEYVILLHDDDRLCRNFLEKQMDIIDNNKKMVALSCNGHVINTDGNKLNKFVLTDDNLKDLRIYSKASQVAQTYAVNSCIPLSPTIYRSSAIKKLQLREEFDKVWDAVHFCDLTDLGIVGCNLEPLYECRVHSGQGSSYFPILLMDQLEEFFFQTEPDSKSKLHTLLLRQRAERYSKIVFRDLLKGNFLTIKLLMLDKKITFINLLCVLFRQIFSITLQFIGLKK